MCPILLRMALKSGTGWKRRVRSPNSPAAIISASNNGLAVSGEWKWRCSPGWTFLLGRTRAVQLSSLICCVKRTSMRPVGSGELGWVWSPALVAYRRAGITRLSLRMRRSPSCRKEGRLRKKLSSYLPVMRFMTSMRLEPRTGGGDWAISSSGRSKLKSDTRKSGQKVMVICGVLDGKTW